MKALGYGPAVLDQVTTATLPFWDRWNDPAYQAIRGREQQMIDAFGGAQGRHGENAGTHSGNIIRGVRRGNPLGRIYHAAATAEFKQEVHVYTGY